MSTNPSPDSLSSFWAWIAYDLRGYRTRANMSGAELGEVLGVVRSVVSRLENAQQLISLPSEVREFQFQYDEIGQSTLTVRQSQDLRSRG
jgi:DNA-binding XRE family transcriptional regulator